MRGVSWKTLKPGGLFFFADTGRQIISKCVQNMFASSRPLILRTLWQALAADVNMFPHSLVAESLFKLVARRTLTSGRSFLMGPRRCARHSSVQLHPLSVALQRARAVDLDYKWRWFLEEGSTRKRWPTSCCVWDVKKRELQGLSLSRTIGAARS